MQEFRLGRAVISQKQAAHGIPGYPRCQSDGAVDEMATMTSVSSAVRMEIMMWLASLYTAWGKLAEAAEWKTKAEGH